MLIFDENFKAGFNFNRQLILGICMIPMAYSRAAVDKQI